MPVYALGDAVPEIHPDAYVHPDAVVIGRVSIGPEATVWPGAVLRGDDGAISIGARTSIQDGAVLHTTATVDTEIGAECVIGHLAHLEGCVVNPESLVGSGAVVLHRVVVGPGSLVGAAALVPNGMIVPPGAQALGVPARLREGVVEAGAFAESVETYVDRGRRYRASLRRLPVHFP